MFSKKTTSRPRRKPSGISASTQQFLDMIGFTPDTHDNNQAPTQVADDIPLWDFEARMAQQYQESAEREARHRAAERAKKTRQAPKIKACAAWWRTNLDRLADEHMKALNRLDAFADNIDWQASQLKERLKVGQRILFQQSDTRWGAKITDKALESLDYEAYNFRFKVDAN